MYCTWTERNKYARHNNMSWAGASHQSQKLKEVRTASEYSDYFTGSTNWHAYMYVHPVYMYSTLSWKPGDVRHAPVFEVDLVVCREAPLKQQQILISHHCANIPNRCCMTSANSILLHNTVLNVCLSDSCLCRQKPVTASRWLWLINCSR